ncbi:Hypothetical predicted protein [Olea europaea subsp. europaea]|uniref:Uncharacterized protein n=1 Tax=Olea europaea subsp. europaea TaxID=158383 RepID=A0A8S0S6Y6_OLEEU|nr:Hypothetical predicted protein [Olea europaea subsp. europaea]
MPLHKDLNTGPRSGIGAPTATEALVATALRPTQHTILIPLGLGGPSTTLRVRLNTGPRSGTGAPTATEAPVAAALDLHATRSRSSLVSADQPGPRSGAVSNIFPIENASLCDTKYSFGGPFLALLWFYKVTRLTGGLAYFVWEKLGRDPPYLRDFCHRPLFSPAFPFCIASIDS